jgi:hypothetical protein
MALTILLAEGQLLKGTLFSPQITSFQNLQYTVLKLLRQRLSFYILNFFIILVLGVHSDVYWSSYNLS